ncbi:MAG: glycosyltransferase [Cyanobacteria bacterium QH_6_48_35]|nr:MAG: glycosyltransferase [Cyanobacteria bacterium QH_6_48_35]
MLENQVLEKNPEITVAIITHNGREVIQTCLESIFNQTYKKLKVFLVNNASTDKTPEWVKINYPSVEILDYPENKGPNPARNLAIRKSPNPLVLLVDDDAVLEENCIAELIKAYQKHPDGAVWSPRIVYYYKQDVIQFEGAYIHYLAEAVLLNGDKPIEDGVKDVTRIQIAGGVSYLVSKGAAMSIGLFDEDYFFGRTDGEFMFRLNHSGYVLYTVPKAISYHQVKTRGLSKVFYQIRNRWDFILTNYAIKTLILLIPMLVIYEISLIIFLLFKRRILDYFKAMIQVIRGVPRVLQKRKSVRGIKKVPDKDILCGNTMNIRQDLVSNPIIFKLKLLLDNIFSFYWKFVSRLI